MKMIEPCLQEAIHYGNISEEELILAIEIVRQKKRTFLNAHLLKEKLAIADTSTPYKYRNKFINY